MLLPFATKMAPKTSTAYLLSKQKGKAIDKGLSKAIVPKVVVTNWGVKTVEVGELRKTISRMTSLTYETLYEVLLKAFFRLYSNEEEEGERENRERRRDLTNKSLTG